MHRFAISFIDSLYEAIISYTVSCFRAYIEAGQKESKGHQNIIEEVLCVDESQDEEIEEPVQTFRSVSQILTRERDSEMVLATKNTVMYAGTVAVPVFRNPTIEFDAQIATIPFGALIMMHEPQGRFYRISWNTISGWVLKDDLVDRTGLVHPQFTVGQENGVDHPNTAHVRTILGDIFGLNRSEFPLQAGEYVLYKLWKRNLKIEWPSDRPRVPGVWHRLLKGVPRIHMSILPKTGMIMEYMINSEIGHVAYVEAVFPDETITLSEAHFPDSGIYNERELSREMWRELRPTFIEVLP